MPRHEQPNPETDPFRPPAIPTEVCCMHCGQEYESYLMEWKQHLVEGEVHGFWCCPTPHCDGRGFGFDIFPTDPDYRGEDGEPMWSQDELDELDESFDTELEAELDMDVEQEWDPIDADELDADDDDAPAGGERANHNSMREDEYDTDDDHDPFGRHRRHGG